MTNEELDLFKHVIAGFAANPAYANHSDMDEILVRKAIRVTELSVKLLNKKKKTQEPYE